MEEKRRDPGSLSPAATISAAPSLKSGGSPATEPPAARGRGKKRKSTSLSAITTTTTTTSSSAPPKRHAREKAAAAAAAAAAGFSPFLPGSHNGPLTRARQLSDSNAAVFSAINATKNEQTVVTSDFEGREEVNLVKEDFDELEAAVDTQFEAIMSRNSNAHVVPVAAGWFSWTNIHPLEKQALQTFFNGKLESRTPELYMEIRNWIMKKFHTNPSTNIELKDLSSLSIGDSDARQEVMEFLDHWGLINYHPFPPNDPVNMDASPSTSVDLVVKTDSLIEKLYNFGNEMSYQQIVPRANKSALAMSTGFFPESAIAEELVKQEGPAVEYHCNSCSADCSRKRYHCQKQADFDLCTECYNNGKFGSGMAPSDFILMEPGEASGTTGGKWTDQETLLLLEALELYKENWNEIAEHVATKTKAQCILHFLQMPIGDGFLDIDDMKDDINDIAEPTSINDEVPVPKDKLEASEGKTGKEESEPAESGNTKLDSEPSESRSGQDDPGPSEKETYANTKLVSTVTETSNVEVAQDGKVTQDKGDNIVLKALKDAFDAVGSPLTSDDKLSFADAGNPVMALTAFLTRLVEPGVVTASARSSLKSLPKTSNGSQLAARHCFLLEVPPHDNKDQADSKSGNANTDQNPLELVHQEYSHEQELKNETNSTNQSGEKSASLPGGTNSSEQILTNKCSISGEDSELPSGRQDICAEKLHPAEKFNEKTSLVAEKSVGETSKGTEKSHEEPSGVAAKTDELKSEVEEKPCETSVENAPVLPNDQALTSPKDQDDSASKVNPQSSANESENLNASIEAAQCSEVAKDVVMESTADLSDKPKLGKVLLDPVIGITSENGEDKMEVDKVEDSKPMVSTETKDESDIAKLKRAAVATLSAAAVKAKLLANQEEDEIRHLAALLIDKQMRKLEIKLSFFTEMDNAIMRVKDQLDRSRQKLFNERAQIIASRLGISASSSRGLPSSFPMNRMPPGLLNSMLRPPMSMSAQKVPSMPRPAVTSIAPATTNASTPPPPQMTGGDPMQPTATERP